MATFLFLVGFTATTLLLLANAFDEVLGGLRGILSRWVARSEATDIEDLRYHEHPARAGAGASSIAKAQRAQVLPQIEPAVKAGEDWVPDRAA